MSTQTTTRGTGLGAGTVLFIVFLTLKLTHTIDWSWWWITAPLWAPLVVALAFLGIASLIATIVAVTTK